MSENVEINSENNEQTSESTNKKRKPFIVKFLLAILYIILAVILVIVAWMTFCALNRTENVKALPGNYSIYVRTDSIYDAVEPLIDLKAMDIVLAEPGLSSVRESFYAARETSWRENFFVDLALSRRLDAALYDENNFVAVLDMGFLSGITRLAPLAYNFISVPNLQYIKSADNSCFVYSVSEEFTIYAKVHKNLVIVSANKEYFDLACQLENDKNYTDEEIKIMKTRLDKPFRIVANAKKLLLMAGSENPYISFIASSISESELSTVEFGISDENINVDISIPFEKEEENTNAVTNLIQKNSKIADIIPKLPGSVQYYTILNIGSLEELKDAAFTVMDEGKTKIRQSWEKGNSGSKLFFGLSLEELLFSWTDDEYAVIGLEGKPDSVFAIKVSDEAKRLEIFDKIVSSIIVQSDSSLLLDGVRLPRLELPDYITAVLDAFNISLPRPYYMVKDGFIYFSQSPENLASMNAAIKNGARLSDNEIWQKLSGKTLNSSSIGLYYNLERSVPFFIKGNSLFNKILQLYNIGKIDISTKDNVVTVKLNSIYSETKETQAIAGFPIQLEGNTVPILYKSPDTKSKIFFLQEKPNKVKALNTGSLEIKEIEINALAYIMGAGEAVFKANSGELWAITKDGLLYLLNGKLETVAGYPVTLSQRPVCAPVVMDDSLIVIGDDNKVCIHDVKGNDLVYDFDIVEQIKSSPTVYKNYMAIYEKGFLGTIHVINKDESYADTDIVVDGIGFGSPCIFEHNLQTYVAFITQSGDLNVWTIDGDEVEKFPMNLSGVFYLNVKYTGESLIAISEDGTVFKVNMDGTATKIKLPHLSAKSGYITINNYDSVGANEIFISGESNAIYGFNSDLEFLNAFPVTGYGIPVFVDLNGDKKVDSLSLSIDNKLNAWKLQ